MAIPRAEVSRPFNFIICLAGPYGAGSTAQAEELENILSNWPACHVSRIDVSEIIKFGASRINTRYKDIPDDDSVSRRKLLQSAGTDLRLKNKELVGWLIISEINRIGTQLEKTNNLAGIGSLIFVVDSLKNVNDFLALKKVYGNEAFLIFIHANEEIRWQRMINYKSWDSRLRKDFEERDLIDRDESIINPSVKDAGQQVGKLSKLADYFVLNHSNRDKLVSDGQRFIELLFGFNRPQPTNDERCMHIAYSSSSRSFCISRQVGAALFDEQGNVISLGYNDPPKFGGGLYSSESVNDKRCYKLGERKCINDVNKKERFNQITSNISKKLVNRLDIETLLAGLSVKEAIVNNEKDLQKLHANIQNCLSPATQMEAINDIIINSSFKDATEYCRAVHAEMEAIIGAARINRSTVNATLYVTTEPCHNCTKHIVCAGIKKVVYQEPYPKSLGKEFHGDDVSYDSSDNNSVNKVLFTHYEGVVPDRYHDLFVFNDLKSKDGKLGERNKIECATTPNYAINKQLWSRSRLSEIADPITLKELLIIKDNLTPFIAEPQQVDEQKLEVKDGAN